MIFGRPSLCGHVSSGIVIITFNAIILTIFFISIEKAVPAHILSLLRGLVLIVPMAFLLSKFAGMTGIWLTYPITESVVSLLGFVLITKFFKTTRKEKNDEN